MMNALLCVSVVRSQVPMWVVCLTLRQQEIGCKSSSTTECICTMMVKMGRCAPNSALAVILLFASFFFFTFSFALSWCDTIIVVVVGIGRRTDTIHTHTHIVECSIINECVQQQQCVYRCANKNTWLYFFAERFELEKKKTWEKIHITNGTFVLMHMVFFFLYFVQSSRVRTSVHDVHFTIFNPIKNCRSVHIVRSVR